MSITPGRAEEDVNPPLPRVGEGVHLGSCSTWGVRERIVDTVHVMVLRSVNSITEKYVVPRRYSVLV
jgi:hypothetical protein